MNDLDLCLEVVSRSRQPLRFIWRWISRKPLEIEVWLIGSKGLPIGNGIWAMERSCDRWRHVTLKGQSRNFNTLRAQYLENSWSYRDSVSTNVLVIPLRGTKSRSPAVFESSRYWALSVLGHEFHLSRSLDVMGYVTIWFPIGHFLLVVLKLSLYL